MLTNFRTRGYKGKLFQTIVLFSVLLCFGSCNENKHKLYDISDFGAVSDSMVVNTNAIQAAIDKCAEDGGGTVVVPAGTFITGAVFFKQGVNLKIEAGGVLKGTTNMADYNLVQTRWEGEERIWVSALVNVFDVTGFHLSGEGTIDGSGDIWFSRGRSWFGRSRGTEASQPIVPKYVGPVREGPPSLGVKGGLNLTPESPAYHFREVELPAYARPRLIAIQNCSDVVVENLTFMNQSSWCLFVLYSKKVEIRNLIIRSEHYIPSSDGIDIDSSDGVHIINVDIDVNDDCIAIKSGKDEDGRRVNRPAENILVENCIFRYGHGGVSMGSEMSGGIRNVTISNCTMMADNWAPIRFKTQPSRGGVVENITYRDLVLDNTKQAFEFNMEWRMVPPVKPPSDPLPVVRNIKIINVSGTVGDAGFMHGLKESPIENVTFENCSIKAKKGLLLDNVKNLDLSGLKISVEEGEAIIQRNITEE
ncbi:glycoside hydrolase family 28 protein [Maribellus mangrovi]|uniref:glycoside hydrolase family 28 protein n=1 Tax=Maribellus mangrovi TaxID=3133146 RepID=UPI0030EDFD5E